MTPTFASALGVLAPLLFAGAGLASVAAIANACFGQAASPTLVIDDPDADGSDPGAWATAIAHTPALAEQCVDGELFGAVDVND